MLGMPEGYNPHHPDSMWRKIRVPILGGGGINYSMIQDGLLSISHVISNHCNKATLTSVNVHTDTLKPIPAL